MKDPNKLPKKDRPSPSDSAKLFEVGKKKKGNDGNMYIIDVDKNNVKKWKIFKKDRPSPSESAKLFKEGTTKKGNDGNMYIIDVDKNGVKRWKMNKKKQDNKDKKSDPINTKKVTKNKKIKTLTIQSFYDLTEIKPKDINKYVSKEPVIKKVIDKVKPEIEKQNIKFYIIPLPLSNTGIYWADYANSYLIDNYGNDYNSSNYVMITIYFEKNFDINYNKLIKIEYVLSKEQLKIVSEIFNKHLPYNYDWNGNSQQAMFILYKKKKIKSEIKIDNSSDYPHIFTTIYLNINKSQPSLFDLDGFLSSKEFKDFEILESKCKFLDYEFSLYDFEMTFHGVKDLKYVKEFLKKIKKNNKLTFGKEILQIKNFSAYIYMTKEDLINGKYTLI